MPARFETAAKIVAERSRSPNAWTKPTRTPALPPALVSTDVGTGVVALPIIPSADPASEMSVRAMMAMTARVAPSDDARAARPGVQPRRSKVAWRAA